MTVRQHINELKGHALLVLLNRSLSRQATEARRQEKDIVPSYVKDDSYDQH